MGSPIRILHVVVNMNRGGAETLLMNLYRKIDRSQIQFDFLTCKKGEFDEEIQQLGGNIYRISYVTEVGHTEYIQGLDYFFESHKNYIIVHSHLDKMSGFVLRSAAKAGVPYRIAHSHNTSSEGGRLARLYKWYAGIHLKHATHRAACSKEAAQWLFKKKAHKTFIIKNGIDSMKFEFSNEIRSLIRKELGINENCLVLGHVGRFNHQKNHEFLIDVFAEVYKENKNSLLLLVGDGELKSSIQQKVKQLGLVDHVKFLGIRKDVNVMFQAFDLFLFPSYHEGLPVSLVEAQCAGIPCLISEKISKEADLGFNLIQYLPLQDPNKWHQAIKQSRLTSKRVTKTHTLFQKNGYDIASSARDAESLYLSLGR